MQSFGCVLKRRCTERCTFSENLPEGWNGGTALEKKQEDGRFCRAYLRTMDPEQAAAEIGRRDGYAMLGQKGTQQKLERMRCDAAAQLKREDVEAILATVLKEFPVTELRFHIPRWMEILPEDHPLKAAAIESAREILKKADQMKDVGGENLAPAGEGIREMTVSRMEMADGTVEIQVKTEEACYFKVISEFSGVPVRDEYELFHTMARLSSMESEYEKVKNALSQVRARGYGIVMPHRSEIVLEEPELIRHGNKYGIKIHAQAPSINLIKAHIETEIAPIVGSEEQARDLIAYIKKSAQKEDGVWETSIFGKSVEQIVEDGMEAKISQMTEDCQAKLQDTLQKIINDSNGGMICIII